jgi:CheY-like chemotaxis protein
MPHQPSRPRQIVVTDDDPKLMAFLVDTLRGAGHSVFATFDADSACVLALILPDLDLVVTNTRWGTVSNRELIRLVRSKRPGLPILHIGKPMPIPVGLLDDVPALPEPFTAYQLLVKVRELVTQQWAPRHPKSLKR